MLPVIFYFAKCKGLVPIVFANSARDEYHNDSAVNPHARARTASFPSIACLVDLVVAFDSMEWLV